MGEQIMSVLLGIGLSAATGFRIFLPFLIASASAYFGYLPLSDNFQWIGTEPALIVFSVAALVEILAYLIPWVDNLLDSIATPAAVMAGAVMMVAVLTDFQPLLKWALAIIAGGSVAGAIQSGTGLLRLTSTATTGGIANPLVSISEALAAFFISILSVFIPVLAFLIVVLLFWILWKKRMKQKNNLAGKL